MNDLSTRLALLPSPAGALLGLSAEECGGPSAPSEPSRELLENGQRGNVLCAIRCALGTNYVSKGSGRGDDPFEVEAFDVLHEFSVSTGPGRLEAHVHVAGVRLEVEERNTRKEFRVAGKWKAAIHILCANASVKSVQGTRQILEVVAARVRTNVGVAGPQW